VLPAGPASPPAQASPVHEKTDFVGPAEGETPRCTEWGNACAPPCPTPCGPPGRFWAGADYLLWWTKSSHVPPLITTSPAAEAGILGPGTAILFGDSNIDYGAFSGFRFELGFWIDREQTIGLAGGGLFLGSLSRSFGAGGSGAADSPTIARPFFNANTGREDSEIVALPNAVAGTINVHANSRLAGGEINGVFNVCCGCDYRLDLLGGFSS
jgi:hypothetical protein